MSDPFSIISGLVNVNATHESTQRVLGSWHPKSWAEAQMPLFRHPYIQHFLKIFQGVFRFRKVEEEEV